MIKIYKIIDKKIGQGGPIGPPLAFQGRAFITNKYPGGGLGPPLEVCADAPVNNIYIIYMVFTLEIIHVC